LHSEKRDVPKTSTDEGIMISIKSVPQNTHFSIRENLDSDSNITEKRDPSSEKQLSLKTSTETGIMILSTRRFVTAFRSKSNHSRDHVQTRNPAE
jgi:hypothetical protein